ncbi:MAG: hypothetical protein IH866_03990 [Chloroflexi bacterium]|nr:hypothetical protein [Chloroflexota bacterium]
MERTAAATVSDFVYLLERAPEDAMISGGKGAGLARLVRSGVPVPPGFVLTAVAFLQYLRANGIEEDLAAGDLEATESAVLERLRPSTEGWPDGIRSQIEAAYESLRASSGDAVAVRSSGTVEDSGSASFAGQHATVLNVQTLDDVLDAVFVCWASLYRADALAYRRAQEVEDDRPAMAVVVQTLVPAEASGVLFTADPVSGDRDVVLIDAAFGLGESVVSGAVTPDHFVVAKADGAIRHRQIATKRVQIVADEGGGVRTEEVSDGRASEASLTEEQVRELTRLATRIEEQAGAPQDIEWSVADGQFYILQARPVTAAAGQPFGERAQPEESEGWVSEFDSDTDEATIWTAANVQEVMPGQLSPFSCAFNQQMIERLGNVPIERMGIHRQTPDPFFAFFYGRPFLNVTMMQEIIDQSPFGSQEAMLDQFFGQARDGGESTHDIDLTALPKRPWLKRMLGYANVTPRVLWQTWRMAAEIRRAEEVLAAFAREDAERPFAEQSEEELIATFEDGVERGAAVSITHISGAGITSSSFEALRSCTERWLGDETGALQATLCTGLAGLESAQPAFELWELSRLVLASDRLRAAFKSHDGTEIERRLDALPDEETAAFRSRLGVFLASNGHRGLQEAEIAAKTWDEDLPTVFSMIRNYLHADPAASPRRIEERQRRAREEATADAVRRLSRWQRPIFRNVLRHAQGGVASREHTKDLLVRATNRGRRITRELARRLAAKGLLAEIWDFYQLTWDEVKALVKGGLIREDVYRLIERRRAEDERNRNVALPETFQGRPQPLRAADLPLPDGDVLRGIAVSPGRVTGIARVIHDPRHDATIEPGEILVAPVTDAGWTPLFVAAAGIVVDIGGTLSHGSTVAREYGLPAVVNVKHGTRMIRSGQTITVDGTAGIVVLEASNEKS